MVKKKKEKEKEKEKEKDIKEIEIEIDISNLNKKAKKRINVLLKKISETFDNSKKAEYQKEIKEILIEYNKKLYLDDSVIHTLETETIYDINPDMKQSENFIGFVFYFWSASTMNFKIIGLYSLEPIFELTNTKEMYYLDKPTMITNDTPIYWVQKGIPFTLEVRIKEQLIELNESIFKSGYNADLVRAMDKSRHFISVYGKERWSLKHISFILSIILSVGLIEFIILSNIYGF